RPYLGFALNDDHSSMAAVDTEGRLWIVKLGESIGEPVRLDNVPPLNPSASDMLAWRPRSREIAAVLPDKMSIVWIDTATRETRWTIKARHAEVTELAFRTDGRQLATSSRKQPDVDLWDAATGSHLRSIKTGWSTRDLAYRPGSDDLAAIPMQAKTV